MTYLEKVMSENPQIKPCELIDAKCPSDFGYGSKTTDCDIELGLDECAKCWNRECEAPAEIVQVSMLVEKYHEGLNDAWELVKKLYEMKFVELEKAFDGHEHLEDIFDNFTPQEALAKLKAYEEAQRIEVGDVVFNKDSLEHCVITHIEGGMVVYCLYDDGSCGTSNIKEIEKIGKRINIKEFLRQLGEIIGE